MQPKLWRQLRVTGPALSFAMLTACANSVAPPPRAADPVIEVRTVFRTLCPAEVRLPLPDDVAVPDGARVEGNAAGLGYVAARFRREEMLAGRLADAAQECAP